MPRGDLAGQLRLAAIISSITHGGPLRSSGSVHSRGHTASHIGMAPPLAASRSRPEIFARHPDYVAAILVAEGVENGPTDAGSDRALRDAEEHLRERGLARAADAPHLAAWRAAFSAFGAKPSRYPSSAEALAARVLRGDALPRVNRLVDAYNAVSVRHLVPVGGEDLDRLEGPLRLAIADGSERFEASDGLEHPRPGEVVWRDDEGVTCRRWNWRQGTRTRLHAGTTRAFFVFDRLAGLERGELETALDELTAVLTRRPGCAVARVVLGAAAGG